jgi:hypothetical protein
MARAPKLKVFRMAVGFHDAYVAAPSQKAAAEAWGADASVFSRKEAELVTDPALMTEPLARPGEVVKRLRGTAAEQIAALGETREAPPKPAAKPSTPAPKPKPRPSRAKVDEAEEALAQAKERQRGELAELKEREAALARERSAIERRQQGEQQRLEAQLEKAEAAYQQALRKWRES